MDIGHRDRPQLPQNHTPVHGPWQQPWPGGPRGLRWQCRPLRSACLPSPAWSSDIHISSGGSPEHGWASAWPLEMLRVTDVNRDSSCSTTTDTDMILGLSPGQDLIMASSYLSVPHCCRVSSFSFLLSFAFSSISPEYVYFIFPISPSYILSLYWCLLQVLRCLSSGCPGLHGWGRPAAPKFSFFFLLPLTT